MNLFTHKWLPRFFYKKYDGGKESGVTGYFLIEWKKVFSVGILHFKKGSRETYHNHAFHALSWFIWGSVTEHNLHGQTRDFKPSLIPKITPRSCFHKIFAHKNSLCFTIRGPWVDMWSEYSPQKNKTTILTHGRKEIC